MAKKNEEPKIKLSIYLIKNEYESLDEIIRNYNEANRETIEDFGCLYYIHSHWSQPSWLNNFFGDTFDNSRENGNLKIYTATSKAVFIVSAKSRTFAISFGYGYTLLNPGVWEERFGLKVVLNIMDPDRLKKMSKRNFSADLKLSTEQIPKDGTIREFGIDIEQDLIEGITAKTKIEGFGYTVTGKDSLHISEKLNIEKIKPFLEYCYEIYESNQYKKDYGWIDHIAETKDPKLIEKLNHVLVENIHSNTNDKLWMAIPEIIPWHNVLEFKYNKCSLGDDIHFETYLDKLGQSVKENLSVETLNRHKIDCVDVSSESTIKSWKVYNCIYCEITIENQIYTLNNGKWYKIETDFVENVSKSFNDIVSNSIEYELPNFKSGETENEYNDRVSEEKLDVLKMDRNIIFHGGANQQSEFCDLFTKDKMLIHVKKYGNSSVLSHLFAQGYVSGRLLLSDKEYRIKVNNKLPADYKIDNVDDKPKPSEYNIVYAIITKSNNDLHLPFFSKVNLRNVKQQLELFGYRVSLIKIPTTQQ